MAVSATPVFPQTPKNSKVQILPADASGLKTGYTGGTNGSKITGVLITSSDTTARDVQMGISTGGTFFPLVTVTIPITAGQVAGTAPISMISASYIIGLPVDSDGQQYLLLSGTGDTLQFKSLTTVTAAKEIDITVFGADF